MLSQSFLALFGSVSFVGSAASPAFVVSFGAGAGGSVAAAAALAAVGGAPWVVAVWGGPVRGGSVVVVGCPVAAAAWLGARPFLRVVCCG